MSKSQFDRIQEPNTWNPFSPTKRDIERTEKLANKNSFAAALLTLLFLPAAMLYLNRGVNSLKIFAYTLCIAIPLSSVITESDEEAFSVGTKVGNIGAIAMMVENINAITLAKKRKSTAET